MYFKCHCTVWFQLYDFKNLLSSVFTVTWLFNFLFAVIALLHIQTVKYVLILAVKPIQSSAKVHPMLASACDFMHDFFHISTEGVQLLPQQSGLARYMQITLRITSP